MKVCSKCKEEKRLECFSKDRTVSSGYKAYCKSCRKESYQNSTERTRLYSAKLKVKYNITLDDYNRMYDNQKGKCPICEVVLKPASYTSHVDHCHKTNKVRGILCRECNIKLAVVEDQDFILNAKKYLKGD